MSSTHSPCDQECSTEELDKLADHYDWFVRVVVSWHPNISLQTLERLAADPDPAVRKAANNRWR